jgi:transcriptional regulator with GAF, ATPase, and Fis domain/predicted hydrocarbon binding protein
MSKETLNKPANSANEAAHLDPPAAPSLTRTRPSAQAMLESFHVDMENGAVWFGDRRVLVLQTSWFLDLRSATVEAIGYEGARAMFTRLGYMAGVRDAQLSMKLYPTLDSLDIVNTGGMFHAMQGSAGAKRLKTEIDIANKHLLLEFTWRNAIEAEDCPSGGSRGRGESCWMEIGYSSGFISAAVGGDVIVREVECSSTGSKECFCIARFAHEWGDVTEDVRYLGTANPAADPLTRMAPVAQHQELPVETPDPEVKVDRAGPFIGRSATFQAVLQQARRVGATTATVLVLGESGVGKSALAQYLHDCSARRDGPFIEVNCASIPETLLESELFGVERGAFTGAATTRGGRFEEAQGGTLFLDEVGLLTPAAQGKLLRVLQTKKYERLGSSKTRQADVRLIAATNDDLTSAVRAGTFRADLFYRLNVFPITVPPLRNRLGDLPLLIDYLVERFCNLYGRSPRGVTPKAYRAMLHHDWPGNIRELENVIERAVILVEDGEAIDLHHLFTSDVQSGKGSLHWLDEAGRFVGQGEVPVETGPASLAAPVAESPWYVQAIEQPTHSLEAIEQSIVMAALRAHEGSLVKTARHLGLSRAQIVYRMNKWGINPDLLVSD